MGYFYSSDDDDDDDDDKNKNNECCSFILTVHIGFEDCFMLMCIAAVSDHVFSLQAEQTALFSVTMSSGVTYFSYQVCIVQ